MRVVLFVLALAVFGAGGANAAREDKCAAQYSLEEQLILEWAALGGDPHAQFAIAKCAAPRIEASLTETERVYALEWLTLAACDADGMPAVDERDRMTRRLKYEGDISFRRFGGISRDETWTSREKQFIEFRHEQVADLKDRYSAFVETATAAERAKAREALSDELARMGPRGMARLTELAECTYFGADKAFAAAVWSAADQVWGSSGAGELYGKSARKVWNTAEESKARLAALKPSERRAAEAEKARLLKTDPRVLAELEDSAALARLGEPSSTHAQAGNASVAGRSVTLAVQYALEALGWIEFVNGPDNDYGPSTIEAAGKAQAAYGFEATRWLSPEQIRMTVCDAATKKGDPVSYYHLAMMFAEGWGFRKDLDRASFAIDRAGKIMSDRLSARDGLPEWKQNAYPAFEPKIENAKALIDGERAGLPVQVATRGDAITEKNLCN